MKKRDQDEYLEQLWYMKENGCSDIAVLKENVHLDYTDTMVDILKDKSFVNLSRESQTISLTEKGEVYARQVIRAHRLAERLISDVFGGDFETGAGEFEHTITPALVDGICTLLGHPRECPHGKRIPKGECCKRLATTAQTSVIPLSELTVGQSAKVSYVQCKSDQQMHRLHGLQIRPGVLVKLHQKYPTIVIECENMSIALDEEVASNIKVWTTDEIMTQQGSQKRGTGLFAGLGAKVRRRRRGR